MQLEFDYRGLRRLSQMALEEGLFHPGWQLEETYRRQLTLKRSDGPRMVIARAPSGKGAGVVWVGPPSPGGVLRLVHIYVKPHYRRRGVASALLAALARHHDVHSFELRTLWHGTEKLRSFWGRHNVYMQPIIYEFSTEEIALLNDSKKRDEICFEKIIVPQMEHLKRHLQRLKARALTS